MDQKITLYDKRSGTADPLDTVVKMKDEAEKEKLVPADNVSKELYRARGVWPFDFMPDEIIVEEQRIIVVVNYFPFGSDIGSLAMNKLSTVEVTHSIFFSSLDIQCTELHGFSAKIKWLRHEDAQKIKEIVDGIKVRETSKVDIPFDKTENISRTLQTLGHIH